jgi:E3 ubiquitin-protein ligase RNF1/2
MECLHRFCAECIEKFLRVGVGRACPACRVKIPTRRSLRPDTNFNAIVATIYPNLEE